MGQQKLGEGTQNNAAAVLEAEAESWQIDAMPVTQIKDNATLQQPLRLRTAYTVGRGLFQVSPITWP